MDPNANLREQSEETTDRARMRELREALAEWLARGGFAPTWADYPDATRAFRQWQRRRYLMARSRRIFAH